MRPPERSGREKKESRRDPETHRDAQGEEEKNLMKETDIMTSVAGGKEGAQRQGHWATMNAAEK